MFSRKRVSRVDGERTSCHEGEDTIAEMGRGAVARHGAALLVLGLTACCLLQGSAAAPRSVAMGIDLGTDNSVVALARKQGVDIVANEASQRSTPSIVSFGHDQRFVGEGGFSQRLMNLKNTVVEPKRMLAKRVSDRAFMDELKVEPFEVVEGEGGEVAVKVQLCGSERVFRPVQVIATLLANLKKIAETDHEAEVVDVAISVPCFFTEHQRRAIRAAAEIAGLKCLRLINDNTATALAYGITKTDLPEAEPRKIAFVDCGRDCMQVSIVAFKKGHLKVLSHAYSKSVSGRRVDSILFDHFAAEFAQKHKLDVRSQDKARLRLILQCEKLKKTLSAVPLDLESPLNVECLMNDMDVSSTLTRQQLETMLDEQKLFDSVAATCQEALTLAGVTKEELDGVELVGGTSRIPALRANLGGFFNKECKTTINAAESVARGAALACAMDSPSFKVREFKVTDWNMYPVEMAYKSQDGAATGSVLLKRGAEVPGAESLKLDTASPVSLEWAYTQDADVAADVPRALASHELKVSAKKGVLKQSVLAKVGLDNSGCVTVAEANLETQVEEILPPPKSKPPPPAPAAADKAGGGAGKADGKDADEEMGEAKEEGDAGKADKKTKNDKKPEDKAQEEKEEEKAPEKRAEQVVHAGYAKEAVAALSSQELDMALQDRVARETSDAKNALEGYVYNMRDSLSTRLAPYEKEDVRAAFSKELDGVEEWLYADGENVNKGIYVEKLKALQGKGDPISDRAWQFEIVPAAFARLEKAMETNSLMSQTTEPKFAHISPEERAGVAAECARAGEWLEQHKKALASASKMAMPPVTGAQVDEKLAELNRFCDAVMGKPKPAPPRPPPKADAPPAPPGPGEGAEADGAKGAGEGTGGAGQAPMDDDDPIEALKRERRSRRAEAGTEKPEGDEDADGPEEMDKMD